METNEVIIQDPNPPYENLVDEEVDTRKAQESLEGWEDELFLRVNGFLRP